MGREKAYRADHLTDHTTGTTGRKGIQYIDSPLEPCHEPAIISPEVADSLGLLLKDIDDGVCRLAIYEPIEDLMLKQVGSRSLLEFDQGDFEKRFELWRGMDGHGAERDGRGLWSLRA